MRLVLVGPPGSGKGTQAKFLTERLHLPYIGTGNLLREAIRQGSPIGTIAEPLLKEGRLVPDAVVNDLVKDFFHTNTPPSSFVADGYPRTVAQAEWFNDFLDEQRLQLDAVVQLMIDDDEVVRRICGRWTCPNVACGASYHETARPPKIRGICDRCGTALTQRADDREATIRNRLTVFHENTTALVEFYRRHGLLREISALQSADEIFAEICRLADRSV